MRKHKCWFCDIEFGGGASFHKSGVSFTHHLENEHHFVTILTPSGNAHRTVRRCCACGKQISGEADAQRHLNCQSDTNLKPLPSAREVSKHEYPTAEEVARFYLNEGERSKNCTAKQFGITLYAVSGYLIDAGHPEEAYSSHAKRRGFDIPDKPNTDCTMLIPELHMPGEATNHTILRQFVDEISELLKQVEVTHKLEKQISDLRMEFNRYKINVSETLAKLK